ncbi:MAG: hypothetical protein V1720_03640 [bacterium]
MKDKKEKLKNLASDPKFISGIYNYCDRWCERCPFTNRCLTYAMTEPRDSDDELDLNNEKFWIKIRESFQLAFELIHGMADEMGIDLTDIDDKDYSQSRERIDKEVRTQPIIIAATQYAKIVDTWQKENEELFSEKKNELQQLAEIGIELNKIQEQAVKFQDLFDVIRWYQIFIAAKLSRAVGGLYDEPGMDLEDYPKDYDGSAKIAVIAIERSIAAWGELLQQFPQKEDSLLAILVLLTKILKETEKIFPNARAFKRPGFDD